LIPIAASDFEQPPTLLVLQALHAETVSRLEAQLRQAIDSKAQVQRSELRLVLQRRGATDQVGRIMHVAVIFCTVGLLAMLRASITRGG
jgi:hypothetical protein